jgi:hypothetical protein
MRDLMQSSKNSCIRTAGLKPTFRLSGSQCRAPESGPMWRVDGRLLGIAQSRSERCETVRFVDPLCHRIDESQSSRWQEVHTWTEDSACATENDLAKGRSCCSLLQLVSTQGVAVFWLCQLVASAVDWSNVGCRYSHVVDVNLAQLLWPRIYPYDLCFRWIKTQPAGTHPVYIVLQFFNVPTAGAVT